MSEIPEYTGVDLRKAPTKQVGLQDAIDQFLAERPADTVALNLGCGQNVRPGFVNVDAVACAGVNMVHDLRVYPWPIGDERVGFVYMSHFLEHVSDWGGFWNEMWRVCAEGARVMIMGPFGRSDRHLQDPTHCQPLVDNKFLYLSKSWRSSQGIDHYGASSEVNFLMDIKPWRLWNQRLFGKSDAAKDSAMLTEWNAVDDCIWYLKAFKSEAAIEAYKLALDRQAQSQSMQGRPLE